MAKKNKKISNAQHRKKAQAIYEEKGQSAVFDYANRHNIGYEFCEACETDSPSINHECLVCGQETRTPIKVHDLSTQEERNKYAESDEERDKRLGRKYVVSVCRTSYAFRDIEVRAKNEKEAKRLALDQAGDHEFSEKDADYETTNVSEK